MKLFTLFFLLTINFTLQAADPSWITGAGLDKYRADKYISAIGEGNSSGDARKNAISGLAEQLKVSISSQSDIIKEYQSSSESFSGKEQMKVHISTEVNLDNLEGIRIAEQYFQQKTNTYFAFAVLDKLKNATDLTFKIDSQVQLVRAQLQQAKELMAKGDSSSAISLLLKTSHLFAGISEDVELLHLFAASGISSMTKDEVINLVTEFDEYLATVFRHIDVVVVSGNQQMGSPELGVSEPLLIEYTYNGSALKFIPVTIDSANDGTMIDADDTTNQRGELQVRIGSFPYTDKAEKKLKAKLDFYDELFMTKSPFAELRIKLSQKSEVSILLKSKIASRYNDFLYLTVNDGLSSVLSEQNYNVFTEDSGSEVKPDYIIEVQAMAVDLPGFSGIKFTKLNGIVSIKSGKTRRKLKTIRIDAESTKAGALSYDMAAEKSTAKLVDAIKDELLQTLENNLGRN